MRKLNSILLGGTVLICCTLRAEPITHDRPWGRLNYTTFVHFNVTFGQDDLKYAKTALMDDGLKVPMGVTHVFLKLSEDFNFIEFPETVKFINKDIFRECNVEKILLSDKTIKNLLKKDYGENKEELIRKYFSLFNNTEILIKDGKVAKETDIPMAENPKKTSNKSLLEEIQNFDRGNLKGHKTQEKKVSADPLLDKGS